MIVRGLFLSMTIIYTMQEFLSSDYICVFKQGETRRRETQNTEQKKKMTRGRSKKKKNI